MTPEMEAELKKIANRHIAPAREAHKLRRDLRTIAKVMDCSEEDILERLGRAPITIDKTQPLKGLLPQLIKLMEQQAAINIVLKAGDASAPAGDQREIGHEPVGKNNATCYSVSKDEVKHAGTHNIGSGKADRKSTINNSQAYKGRQADKEFGE